MASLTGLDQLATKHGFLLVYLQGRNANWPPFISPENPEQIDLDLEFFDATRAVMVAQYAADPSRVYVVGVSQGGAMCNLLVARRSERIAAAVCNCGWLPQQFDAKLPQTLHKTPMLFLAGSLDVQVPPDVVRQAHDVFAQGGHPVEFKLLEGVSHGWTTGSGINELIWQFLSSKKLCDAAKGAAHPSETPPKATNAPRPQRASPPSGMGREKAVN
jgi:dienelactone hydrolase